MMRCTRCVLSERFPRIVFDRDGICNYCHQQSTEPELDRVLLRNRIDEYFQSIRGKYHYDAIVCYSGGKDSTYTLNLAVKRYGLKVLAFTFDNGFLSSNATSNIDRVVEELGVDLIRFKANKKVFNEMIKLSAVADVYPKRSLTRVSSVCQTCINLINLKALEFAVRFKVPAIIAGFTLGQIPKSSVMYEFKYVTIQEYREMQNLRFVKALGPHVADYLQLDNDISTLPEYPQYINLLAVEPVGEIEILDECRKLGWQKPEDTDGCSSNCRLNSVGNAVAVSRLGFHPYESELSCLVRNGMMSREEAISKLENFGSKEELARNAGILGVLLDE